jgi:hypothetical protein
MANGPWDSYAASPSAGPWGSYAPDPQAAQAAADAWRAKTGAGPDVPTPFDAGLPQSIPSKSAEDKVEDFSSAAGEADTAGLERSLSGANILAGGLAGALGLGGARDEAFSDAQAQAEDAARRSALAQGQNKAGAVTGNVLSFVPAMLTGGAGSVPGIIGGQQAVNTAQDVIDRGGSTGQAEKAFFTGLPLDVATNAIPGEIPGLGPATGKIAGAVAGAGGQAVSQEIQHQVSPDYVEAPNVKDASNQAGINLLSSILVGGHETPEQEPSVDPYLRNYQQGAADQAANAPPPAPAPRALPAPTNEHPAEAAPPTPTPAPTGPSAMAAASFRQDPKTALNALDHDTLVQVAQDSGLDVKPTDSHAAIVNKVTALSPSDLEQHVLPEYLANLKAEPSPEGIPSPQPQAPTSTQGAPAAATSEPPLPANTTIPVDAAGTAYTPEQGASAFNDALDRARGVSGRLPQPVTTVDSMGRAETSKSFNDALEAARSDQQQRRDLGITPDIERSQNERWIGNELANFDSADRYERERALAENAEAQRQRDEMVPQTEDFAPEPQPWWRAGQDAEEQHNQVTPAQSEVPTQGGMRDSDAAYGTPDRHPWIELDKDHNIPLAGGVDDAGNKVYVSKYMPHEVEADGKTIDADEGVFVHEVEEQKVMRPTGPKDDAYMAALRADIKSEGARMPEAVLRRVRAGKPLEYPEAHHIATIRENAFIRQKYGLKDPNNYQKALADGITAAREGAKDEGGVPLDLDRRPYDDLDDEHLLPEVSNELAKLNIPEELHPQAQQFLAHVEHALDSGVDVNAIHEIARDTSDLPSKLAKIDQLTEEAGGHALTGSTQTQSVPRETSAAPLRETSEAGEPSAQQESPTPGEADDQAEHEPTLSDRSDELNDQAGAHEYVVPPTDRRPDWTPQLEGRAITAIDHLVERFNGSTLADSLNRDLKETQVAQLIGQKIESPEDLAAMAAMVYRNPSFETFRYIGVDDKGNVLGEMAVSSRMPSSTKAFPTGTTNAAKWIKDGMPDGVTKIWLMHNHPSGNPAASKADVDVTGSLAITMMDTPGAPKIAGHVILDHDTFGYIDAEGDNKGVQKLTSAPTIDPTRYARGDVDMFAHKVESPQFAAYTGQAIANATPKDHSAIVIMDAGRNVVSVHTFPNDFLMSPKGAATVSRLGQKSGAVGIGIVMDGKAFTQNRDAFNKAAKRGFFRNAYVVSPSGTVIDVSGEKFLPQGVRTNFGKQSAATIKRSKAGVRAFENTPGEQPLVSLSTVRKALADRGMSDEQIKAMTSAQLRAEQANLRRRSEPTPEETQSGAAASINKATVDEERQMKGQAALEFDMKRSNPQALDEAKQSLAKDPDYGTKLAAEIIDKPRALTQPESFALMLDKLRIKNATDDAHAALKEAMANGDRTAMASAQVRQKILDAQMDNNQLASRRGLGLAAQTLQSARYGVNDDYSLAKVLSDARGRVGRDLTSAERAALEKRVEEVTQREQAVAAREKALQDQRREPRAPKERAAAKSKFDSIAEQLKKIAQKDQMKPGCVV